MCTYRLSWAKRTSWGWWDEWDDTALQTQDSKFEPWRSKAEHATSWSRRLPAILSFTSGWLQAISTLWSNYCPNKKISMMPRQMSWACADAAEMLLSQTLIILVDQINGYDRSKGSLAFFIKCDLWLNLQCNPVSATMGLKLIRHLHFAHVSSPY